MGSGIGEKAEIGKLKAEMRGRTREGERRPRVCGDLPLGEWWLLNRLAPLSEWLAEVDVKNDG